MTACREARELLSSALDQALSAEEQARLAGHLEACPECRAYQRALAETHARIRAVEPVEPPPWLVSRTMARIRAEAAPKASFWRRVLLPLVAKPQFQMATLLLVGATSYFLLKSRPEASHDAVIQKLRPAAEPEPKLQEAPPAPGAAKPGPAAQDELREEDARRAPAEDAKRKQDQPASAPPPPAAAAPALMPSAAPAPPPPPAESSTAGFAEPPRPASPPSKGAAAGAGASGVVGNTAPLLDDRAADLAKSSRKAAAPAPERAREARSEDKEEQSQAAPVLVQWTPDDVAEARRILARELADLGASVVSGGLSAQGKDRGEGRLDARSEERTLTARLDGRRLPELLARLQRHGTLRTAPAQQQQQQSGARSGAVVVIVRW